MKCNGPSRIVRTHPTLSMFKHNIWFKQQIAVVLATAFAWRSSAKSSKFRVWAEAINQLHTSHHKDQVRLYGIAFCCCCWFWSRCWLMRLLVYWTLYSWVVHINTRIVLCRVYNINAIKHIHLLHCGRKRGNMVDRMVGWWWLVAERSGATLR